MQSDQYIQWYTIRHIGRTRREFGFDLSLALFLPGTRRDATVLINSPVEKINTPHVKKKNKNKMTEMDMEPLPLEPIVARESPTGVVEATMVPFLEAARGGKRKSLSAAASRGGSRRCSSASAKQA